MDLPKDFGRQPLDELINRLELTNHDLVAASTEQITHKMIKKAREGRRLSRNVQNKILNALNACHRSQAYAIHDLFTYDGK